MTRIEVAAGGRTREALIEAPPDPARPLPLLIMYHGAGATAELARVNTGWGAAARRRGFIAAFPEGIRRDQSSPPAFRQNPQAWNDGSGRGHTHLDVDDVAFGRKLIDVVAERWPVDPARIYATGFSNGGAFVFRLAAELADRLAAVAPVAGHLWDENPRPSRSVPLLLICGTADPLNPLDGGTVDTPWGRSEYHPPVAESARRWAAAIGCAPQASSTEDQPGVRTMSWKGPAPAEVRFTTIEGLGHAWPGGRRLLPEWIGGPSSDLVDGTATIWTFLSGHHL